MYTLLSELTCLSVTLTELCAGDFHALMELTDMTDFETMLTNDVESTYEQCTDSTVETVTPFGGT